jgi:hypothetical protein
MLSSDDPVINPSNRSHPDLVAILWSLLQPKDAKTSTKESLNMRLRSMYDSVVPFAFLGSIYTPVHLSTSVVSDTDSGSTVNTTSLYKLLTDSVLVDNYHVDTKKIFSYANLTTYLQANR